MKLYSADFILPVTAEPIPMGVVAVNGDGTIEAIYRRNSTALPDLPIETYDGIIVPGFVNAHCHLELSYLKSKIPAGNGLIPFVKAVVQSRKADESEINDAMIEADETMWQNGIVAVGDISNVAASKDVKLKSKLFYHTFIELIGFDPTKAVEIFQNGLRLKEEFSDLSSSIVPHAAYSVCKELLKHIYQYSQQNFNLISIHNQETEEENRLFRYKTGEFIQFYKDLNIDIDFFRPQARNSVQSVIPLLPQQVPILLVHNTFTSLKDIYFVRRFNREVSWCFCPKANLYIEGCLPKIDLFLFDDFNITIGTDSLASNNQLCILSELKTIHMQFPGLKLQDTIKWATLNGAKFLRVDKEFGSLEIGKKPGLNLITDVDGFNLTPHSQVKRLV